MEKQINIAEILATKPKVGEWLITRWVNCENIIDFGTDINFSIKKWKRFVERSRIDKWCYAKDLLAKKGGSDEGV